MEIWLQKQHHFQHNQKECFMDSTVSHFSKQMPLLSFFEPIVNRIRSGETFFAPLLSVIMTSIML